MEDESQELHACQIRCAEQQDIIELLERKIKRLNEALSEAKDENRFLDLLIKKQRSVGCRDKPKPEKQEKKEENRGKQADETEEDDEEIDFDKYVPLKDNPVFSNNKDQIIYECSEFMKKNSFNDFFAAISQDIIGQEEGLKKMLAVIYHYLQTLATGEKPEKCNAIILTAPSGNGKTALAKCLARYFQAEIPSLVCSQKDTSRLLPDGYRGVTVSSVLSDFAENRRGQGQKYGILWLDEFDKIKFNHDSGGPEVTAQLLALMDGHVDSRYCCPIDTSFILWIASGSFNEIRKKKKNNVERSIGFTSANLTYDAFDIITRDDMLQVFSHEIIGRFSLVINLKRLTKDAVTSVIMKTVGSISNSLKMNIILSEEYMEMLINNANSEFGCRQIYSILYEECIQAYIAILQSGLQIGDVCSVILESVGKHRIVKTIVDEKGEC